MIGGEFFSHRAPFAAGDRSPGGSSRRNPETPACPGVREEKPSPGGVHGGRMNRVLTREDKSIFAWSK